MSIDLGNRPFGRYNVRRRTVPVLRIIEVCMNLVVEKSGEVSIVVLPDEYLDASNSTDFKDSIADLLDGKGKVVLDMSAVEFVDSSGCGAILSCLRKLNSNGGDLKLCCVTKPVRTLFELVRMHRVFDILNTRDEAVKAFS